MKQKSGPDPNADPGILGPLQKNPRKKATLPGDFRFYI
jgi:hypothetical protein